jgi:hypothetical protein
VKHGAEFASMFLTIRRCDMVRALYSACSAICDMKTHTYTTCTVSVRQQWVFGSREAMSENVRNTPLWTLTFHIPREATIKTMHSPFLKICYGSYLCSICWKINWEVSINSVTNLKPCFDRDWFLSLQGYLSNYFYVGNIPELTHMKLMIKDML